MRLIFWLIVLAPVMSHAKNYDEVLVGGLTYHLYGGQGQTQFSNKLTSDGALIANPLAAYRQVIKDDEGFYKAETVFAGANSLAEPMFGYAYSGGASWGTGRVGLLAGLYLQDNSKYLDKGMIPPMLIPHGCWGPVPVVGIEVVNDVSSSVFVDTLITPIFLNLSFGYRF